MKAQNKQKLLLGGMVVGGVMMLSPFAGAIGTALGMMRSFEEIQTRSYVSDPGQLAEAIGESLTATAVGVFVGIPGFLLFLISFILFLLHRKKRNTAPPPVPQAPVRSEQPRD
jgi:biopolymer transport protein ExbB/TolQ